jgi:hypothetical protein
MLGLMLLEGLASLALDGKRCMVARGRELLKVSLQLADRGRRA